MNMIKLNDNVLRIYLDRKDMEKYGLSMSNISVRTVRSILLEFYDDISERLGADLEEEKLYVEVMSQRHSCTIWVSCSSCEREGKRRRYVKDKAPCSFICEFESFEELRGFCRSLFLMYPCRIKSSSLCCGSRTLRLFMTTSADEESILRSAAANKGLIIPTDKLNCSVTNEYYHNIIEENAVEKILSFNDSPVQ